MRHMHVLAIVLLAVWLVLTGFVGLAGIAVPTVLAAIMNVVALASGVLFLVTVGKCYCECDKCSKCDIVEKK